MKKRGKKLRSRALAAGYKGPLKMVRDPASGVAVAAYADDRGTPEMLRKISEELAEFVDAAVLPFPLKSIEVCVGGKIQQARVKKDGIDLMHDNKTISDIELLAAREFQAAFLITSRHRYGSVMFDQAVGGGGEGSEDFMQRRIDAAHKVTKMLDMAGGSQSRSALAVERIAGRGWTLRRMAGEYDGNANYWRGVFVCGLEAIARQYLQGRGKPRLGMLVDVIA